MHRFPHRVAGCRAEMKGDTLSLFFSSFDAFVRQAEAPAAPTWGTALVSRQTERPRWAGTHTFAEALRLARHGWAEGRKQLLQGALDLRDLSGGSLSIRSEDRAVAGSRPDVPLFCAGDPEHMIVPGDRFGPAAPFVDLYVHCSVSDLVKPADVFNHGIALLSLVDATEAQNRRARVTACFGVDSFQTSDALKFRCFVRLKDHGEPLDLHRMAFGLANPAMFRRLVFALIEQVHGDDWSTGFGGSYGTPVTREINPDGIAVPSPQHWRGHSNWTTPTAAYTTMRDALVTALETADEAA